MTTLTLKNADGSVRLGPSDLTGSVLGTFDLVADRASGTATGTITNSLLSVGTPFVLVRLLPFQTTYNVGFPPTAVDGYSYGSGIPTISFNASTNTITWTDGPRGSFAGTCKATIVYGVL